MAGYGPEEGEEEKGGEEGKSREGIEVKGTSHRTVISESRHELTDYLTLLIRCQFDVEFG